MKMQKSFLTLAFFLSIIFFANAQVNPGTYTITNKNSNLCLAIKGATRINGEEGTQWTCDGGADKNWNLIDAGNGYFKIQNQNSSLFLAVGGGARDNGGRCIQYVDQGQQDIFWRFISAGAGWYKIQNKNSGLFLAIGAGSRTGGADLIQWGDEGQEDLKWKLTSNAIKTNGWNLETIKYQFKLPLKSCIDWPNRETSRPLPTCNNCSIQPLTAVNAKMWATGSTLRVRMDGGSNIVRSKVQQFANEWSNHANIRFNFINSGNAEIIITFGNDGKSYSKIGTDAVDLLFRTGAGTGIVPNETMHFGWFTDTTPDEEFRRTVLHEFGHALGFVHEHQNPSSDIPWNREAVYAAYGGAPNNWSRADVDLNLFQRYSRNQTQFTQYDPTSIMHYAIDPAHTLGGFSTPWNTFLSPTDIAFARAMYPAGRITGNRIKVTVINGTDDLRVNSQAFLAFKLRSGAVREMQISLNRGAGWGGGSTNLVEIPMPEGTSAGDVIQCKLIFASGKQFPWDDPDNWDVNRVILEWVTPENFATILSDQRGTPFIRFANTGDVFLFNR